MSTNDKYYAVQSNPVLRYAYQKACQFRELNTTDRTVGGKRVGNFKFECTQRLIASIVYDNHQVL